MEVERPIIDMLRAHRKAQLERQMASQDWVATDTIFTGRNGGVLHPQNVRKAFEAACAEAVFPASRRTVCATPSPPWP